MADPAPRKKTPVEPLPAREGTTRALARSSHRTPLPTAAALVRAGALVSAAVALGVGAVACHGDDAATIAPDEPKRGDRWANGKFLASVQSSALVIAEATSSAITPPDDAIRTAGVAPPHVPTPVTSVSASTTTSPVGLATPPATAPTPRHLPGGPMIAKTVAPIPTPPPVGGKPRAVVPPSGAAATQQTPCPDPTPAGSTI